MIERKQHRARIDYHETLAQVVDEIRKYFHVTIYRTCAGRYEIVTYAL